MHTITKVQLPKILDERGNLSVIEENKNIPFEIKRVYCPDVTFANDKYPRSKQYPEAFQKTIINDRASIGLGAVIQGVITICKNAMIGAGTNM